MDHYNACFCFWCFTQMVFFCLFRTTTNSSYMKHFQSETLFFFITYVCHCFFNLLVFKWIHWCKNIIDHNQNNYSCSCIHCTSCIVYLFNACVLFVLMISLLFARGFFVPFTCSSSSIAVLLLFLFLCYMLSK
jgi:uncharacterized membrane protein YidH (DUF202 family)